MFDPDKAYEHIYECGMPLIEDMNDALHLLGVWDKDVKVGDPELPTLFYLTYLLVERVKELEGKIELNSKS